MCEATTGTSALIASRATRPKLSEELGNRKTSASGSNSYVTIGSWLDPLYQKTDIHISTVNENGVDYLPINRYLGLDNAYNDGVSDAIQFGDGSWYAGVGNLDDKRTFFKFKYENGSFQQPFITQGFPSNLTLLSGVCALANNQGFMVCGWVFDGWTKTFVARIDNAGSIVWTKILGSGYSTPSAIVATPDGGCLLGGQEFCANLACTYPVLYKLDGNGDYE